MPVIRMCLKRVLLFVSKRPVHDVEANVSVCRVTKRLRNRSKDPKAERAPQPDRRRVGFDNRVELHRSIAVRPRLVQDMAAQSTAHALTAACRVNDKPGIGNVRPRAGVDGMSVCAPDDASIVIHGDNGPPGRLSHPPSAGSRFGSCRIPRQRLPVGTLLFQDQPDSRPVLWLRLTYHPDARMAQPARICRVDAGALLGDGHARSGACDQGRQRQNSLPSGSARTTQFRSPWPTSACRAPRAARRLSSAA
jgi:hypothetical protein